MYPAHKLNKQGDNIHPWCTPFPIWKQSAFPCLVLTVASWPTTVKGTQNTQFECNMPLCVCVCVCVCLVAQSYMTLCGSMDCSQPGSSVHEVLQAGILKLFPRPSSRGSSQTRDPPKPGIEVISPTWQATTLPFEPPGKHTMPRHCIFGVHSAWYSLSFPYLQFDLWC